MVKIEPSDGVMYQVAGSSEGRSTLHPEAMKLLAPPNDISRDGRLLHQQAAIDEAPLVMLADQGLVSQAAAADLLNHILDLQNEGFHSLAGRDPPRSLYLACEAGLAPRAGPEKAGWLHLARSRNDLNPPISLLLLREAACSVSREIGIVQDALIHRTMRAWLAVRQELQHAGDLSARRAGRAAAEPRTILWSVTRRGSSTTSRRFARFGISSYHLGLRNGRQAHGHPHRGGNAAAAAEHRPRTEASDLRDSPKVQERLDLPQSERTLTCGLLAKLAAL
ncbi:hypothetical protein MPLSOD_180015 [Mesorhizobium sp. SOD10]|nr:hypothetical protein MPLSOD_180015 [Mesorhizobium sp. SOD10]